MSELDPNGVEAAAVAMTGAPFPSKRSLAKAEAAIAACLSAVSPLSEPHHLSYPATHWRLLPAPPRDGGRP